MMELVENSFSNKEISGCLEVNRVEGRSVVTRLFCKYPLKLIKPSKAAPSSVDVVWIFALSYGGGFVSGDSVFIKIKVGNQCTLALTTQASTKIYKSINGQLSEQLLQVFIEKNGVFVLLPDPVTCYAAAKYSQVQAFHLSANASVVLVDWCTSGRRERGEVWTFDHYRSTNHVFLDGKGPLFLDSMCLGSSGNTTILSRMQPFQVVAMVLIYGPQVESVCRQLEEAVKNINQKVANVRPSTYFHGAKQSEILMSSSRFGPKESGLVVRIVSTTTELVFDFLKCHLSSLSSIIGVTPYSGK